MLFKNNRDIERFGEYACKQCLKSITDINNTEPSLNRILEEISENWYPYFYQLTTIEDINNEHI